MTRKITREFSEQLVDREKRYPRDRIVVIGRRSSGKTVYISLLYDKLWNSHDCLKMKAVKGTDHAGLIKTAASIRAGNWPPATQGISQSFIEVSFNEQTRMMVILDYPGEVFTDAFVRDVESKEVDALFDHIDHASAVILLVDPAHVVEGDVDSQIDHDYGILQAIDRIQNWPGGGDAPVVLALTKADQTEQILKKHGGTRAFVNKYFSSLVQNTRHLKVCKISAMPEIRQDTLPDMNKDNYSLVRPLLYCLERLTGIEAKLDEKSRYHRTFELCKQIEKKEWKRNIVAMIVWPIVWGVLFALLLFAVVRLLPSTVWTNFWYNLTGK